MKRWRFWISQFIWMGAMGAVGLAVRAEALFVAPVILLLSFILTGFTLKWGTKGKHDSESNVMGYESHVVARVFATGLIWITYLIGTVTAVIEMAGWGVLLALILMIPAIAFTALLWTWERISGVADQRMQSVTEQSEKRKRERIDNVLRDLSDEDLLRLKDRLADGRIDDELLYEQVIGDDGELIYRH